LTGSRVWLWREGDKAPAGLRKGKLDRCCKGRSHGSLVARDYDVEFAAARRRTNISNPVMGVVLAIDVSTAMKEFAEQKYNVELL